MIVYHRTSPENGRAIVKGGRFLSKELGEICVSNRRNGEATGYGPFVIRLQVPARFLKLDDEFPTGKPHYRINARDISSQFIVGGA